MLFLEAYFPPLINILTFYFFVGDIAVSIIKGPAEALLGVVYGVIGGIVLWYIPAKGVGLQSEHISS